MNEQPLYARFPTNITTSTIVYESIPVGFDDTMPKIKTNISTPVVSVDIVGVGGVSIIQQGGSNLPGRVTEQVIVAESITINLSTNLEDSSSTSEDLALVSALASTIQDTIDQTESIAKSASINKADSTISIVDSLAKALGTNVSSDSTSIIDSYSINLNKNLSDSTSIYEGFTSEVVSFIILLEDGFELLLESGAPDYVLVELVGDTLTDSTSSNDFAYFIVNKNPADTSSNSEVISTNVSKPYNDSSNIAESVSLSTSRTISDTVFKQELLSFNTSYNIPTDSMSISDTIILATNKTIADTTFNSDILNFGFSKLFANSTLTSEDVTFVIQVEDYLLREDTFLILKEDGTFISREYFSLFIGTEYTTSSEILTFNLNRGSISESTNLSSSEIVSKNTSKPFTDTTSNTEDVQFSLVTHFILLEDNVFYLLLEDGSRYVLE